MSAPLVFLDCETDGVHPDREQHPEINLKPWPQLPWESDDLTAALGLAPVPAAERHTALGDARWAARMYDAIMAGGAR